MNGYPNSTIQRLTGITNNSTPNINVVPTSVGCVATSSGRVGNSYQTPAPANYGSQVRVPINNGATQAAAGASQQFNNLKNTINSINIDGNIGNTNNGGYVTSPIAHVTSNMGTATQSIDISRGGYGSVPSRSSGGAYNGYNNPQPGIGTSNPGLVSGGGNYGVPVMPVSPTNPVVQPSPNPGNTTILPVNPDEGDNHIEPVPQPILGGGSVYIDDGRVLKPGQGDNSIEPVVGNPRFGGGQIFIDDGKNLNPRPEEERFQPVDRMPRVGDGQVYIDDGEILNPRPIDDRFKPVDGSSEIGGGQVFIDDGKNIIPKPNPVVGTPKTGGGQVIIDDGKNLGVKPSPIGGAINPVDQSPKSGGGQVFIDDGKKLNPKPSPVVGTPQTGGGQVFIDDGRNLKNPSNNNPIGGFSTPISGVPNDGQSYLHGQNNIY